MNHQTTKKSFFSNPVLRTRITSANVKPKEMFLGYFVGPFCALISNAIFGSFLNRYYTDVIGITRPEYGAFSALYPMISVIFVVLGNLLVGQLIERTRTNQGKARPWLLLSALLVPVAICLLFLVPVGSSPTAQMAWIAVSYNLYYAVAYPFFYTAHSSLVGLSTRNSKHRGLLATFSNASGVAAVGIGASILVPLLLQSLLFVEGAGGGIDTAASYNNWRIVMLVLVVLTFFAILIEYFFTRERITEENMKLNIKEEKIPMLKQLKAVVNEKYWWFIILYFLLFQFSGLLKNSSMTFYCKWMLQPVSLGGMQLDPMFLLGLVGGIPTAIGMVVAWPIAAKLGKKNAVVGGLVISVLGGLVSFIDVHNLYIVCAGVVLKGIGSIPAMYVTLALLSDVLDHLEAKNGFRSDGFTMSVYGAIMVGLSGLGNGILNALLSANGYNAELASQPKGVETALVVCYLAMELICYAVIAVLLCFLTVEKHIDEDHKIILEHQRQAVLAAGGEWIEPAERLRMEQEEADRLADEARRAELKAWCEKKGKSFEEEESKYEAAQEAKRRRAEERAAAKAAKKK